MNNTGKDAPRPDNKNKSLNFTQGKADLLLSARVVVQASTVTSVTSNYTAAPSVKGQSPATNRHNSCDFNPLSCTFRCSLIITDERVIKWRIMRWAGHVARMGERRDVYSVLVGKPERKRPLGRPRRRWEDNIKIDIQEVVCVDVERIELAQDRDRWR